MKDKKKMRLIIALAVLLLGGLVYYWFFYTPSLGDYVYLESRNQYSAIAHSREDCSRITGGIRRLKTSIFLSNLNSTFGLKYCSKCITCDMLIEYSNKNNVPISNINKISPDNSDNYVCEERQDEEISVSNNRNKYEEDEDEEEYDEVDEYIEEYEDEEDEESDETYDDWE